MNTVYLYGDIKVRFIGAQLNLERAFNPSRSVRRGWAVWYRAPVLLTVIATVIIGLGIFADAMLRDLEIAAFSELINRLPAMPYGVTIPTISRGSFNPAFFVWIAPILVMLAAIMAILDVISFRIHWSVITLGRPSSKREGLGVKRLALRLFGFYFLSFGAIVGSIVVAGALGLAVLLSGVSSASPGVAVFGLGVFVLSVIPAWIYVSFGLYLGSRVVVFEQVTVVEALERSWALAKGNRWPLIVFRLILSLFVLAGALVGLAVCGVGVLISLPVVCAVTSASLSEAFMLATHYNFTGDWQLPIELGESPL